MAIRKGHMDVRVRCDDSDDAHRVRQKIADAVTAELRKSGERLVGPLGDHFTGHAKGRYMVYVEVEYQAQPIE